MENCGVVVEAILKQHVTLSKRYGHVLSYRASSWKGIGADGGAVERTRIDMSSGRDVDCA